MSRRAGSALPHLLRESGALSFCKALPQTEFMVQNDQLCPHAIQCE